MNRVHINMGKSTKAGKDLIMSELIFTNELVLRPLMIDDFEIKSERKGNGFEETTYKLRDEFDDDNLAVYCYTTDSGSNYTLSYQDSDHNDVFFGAADSFEDVLRFFRDWRAEMCTRLLFLPNKVPTIIIERK